MLKRNLSVREMQIELPRAGEVFLTQRWQDQRGEKVHLLGRHLGFSMERGGVQARLDLELDIVRPRGGFCLYEKA